jgi:hypothetical protein
MDSETQETANMTRGGRGWLEELTEYSARELERLQRTGAQGEAELYRRARALVLAHLESLESEGIESAGLKRGEIQ